MTIRLKSRGRLLFPTAIVSVTLLVRVADAQISAGPLDQGMSGFSDTATAPTGPVQGFLYGIDAGIGETDNVTLAPTDKISQTIATVDADFTVHQRSRLFDVNAMGNFSDLNYLQDAYGN